MIVVMLKVIVYFSFGILYIVNNSQLQWVSKKIRRELIAPYTTQYEVTFVTPTPDPMTPTSTQAPTQTPPDPGQPTIVVTYVTTTPIPSTVTEDDLWHALSAYRQSHGKNNINKSEPLCVYARERARELFDRLATDPDSPLDGHEGFIQDANSGYIGQITGAGQVGENLAYLPNYSTAIEVIEWGWDTSPGHRSLQLSTDIRDGCIAVVHPIYVGTYSY